MNEFLQHLLNDQISVAGHAILWREIIGNIFGLASAIGGLKRAMWAWPVGIIGNAVLFTVFLGGVFDTPSGLNLYGQAGRQIMFIAVSIYGWRRWRGSGSRTGSAVQPRWGTARERVLMVSVMIVGTVLFAQLFGVLGSYGKWADAWIFTGSMLATFGMARGLTEFWLIWIGVDVVGVPLLVKATLYPSAALYVVYSAFVLWGFFVWLRVTRTPQRDRASSQKSDR